MWELSAPGPRTVVNRWQALFWTASRIERDSGSSPTNANARPQLEPDLPVLWLLLDRSAARPSSGIANSLRIACTLSRAGVDGDSARPVIGSSSASRPGSQRCSRQSVLSFLFGFEGTRKFIEPSILPRWKDVDRNNAVSPSDDSLDDPSRLAGFVAGKFYYAFSWRPHAFAPERMR